MQRVTQPGPVKKVGERSQGFAPLEHYLMQTVRGLLGVIFKPIDRSEVLFWIQFT
jgi:hypothetical protein